MKSDTTKHLKPQEIINRIEAMDAAMESSVGSILPENFFSSVKHYMQAGTDFIGWCQNKSPAEVADYLQGRADLVRKQLPGLDPKGLEVIVLKMDADALESACAHLRNNP